MDKSGVGALVDEGFASSGTELRNYHSIDVAKFVCAILVVVIHVAPLGEQGAAGVFSDLNFVLQQGLCRAAVPLFFVFSGFLLYRKTTLDGFLMQPTKKYLRRVLGLYLAWSLLYVPFAFLDIYRNPHGILSGIVLYARNFLLTGSHFHLWYLPALMFAVALVSLLLHKGCAPKKILFGSLAFYVVGLLGDSYVTFVEPLFDSPVIGEIINLYFRVFDTTRNGLFFAFFFVSLGMVFAFGTKSETAVSTKGAFVLFMGSLVMMCIEAWLLRLFAGTQECNLLVFAVPAALFGMMFLKSVGLKERGIYRSLRGLSSLVFYVHMWGSVFAAMVVYLVGEQLFASPVHFLITLAVSFGVALYIMHFSGFKGLRWLKKLY